MPPVEEAPNPATETVFCQRVSRDARETERRNENAILINAQSGRTGLNGPLVQLPVVGVQDIK